MPIDNEILGPKLWLWKGSQDKKWHVTGGYGQPDMKKTLCAKSIPATSSVISTRAVVCRKGGRDYKQYCLKCLNLVGYEALEEKIIFSAVKTPDGGTFGGAIISPQLNRRSPQPELNEGPKRPKKYKIKDVAGSQAPVRYKHRLKSQIEKKEREKAASKAQRKRKVRSDKGVKRGPRIPKVDKGPDIMVKGGKTTAKDIIGRKGSLRRSSPSVEEES